MLLDARATGIGGGSGGAPVNATYITQTPNAILTNEQAMSALATGLIKNATGTGVFSIAALGTDYYGPGGTDVAIADGGSGQSTQQAAIDALTNVAAATNEHVLTKDTGTGNAIFKVSPSAPVTSVFGRVGVVVAAGGDYTASQITNIPAGGIAAVNIQTAINELDTEKQPLDATLTSLSALGTAADRIAYTTGIDTWAETPLTAFGRSLIDDTDAATARTTLGLAIGSNVQAYDAFLTSIAALGTAADKIIYTTALDTAAETALTAFARTILDDANQAAVQTTLGVVPGTDVQAWDAQLDDIAALAVTDSNFIVGNGVNWVAESGATARASLGLSIGSNVQAYDAFLTSIAALGTAADKLIYTTGVDVAAETALTAYARTILDDADEATFKATVNLEIGTDVQAYDATLQSISSLGTAADRIAYTTGIDTWAETPLTSFARSILDDADEATFKATVNLEIGTDVQAWDTQLDDIAALAVTDSNFIVGNGANWVAESGNTARTSLALGTGDSPQFTGLTLTGTAALQGAVNVETVNGIDVNPGSDTDADLITVGVTGAPNLMWDESDDSFLMNKKFEVNFSDASQIKGMVCNQTYAPGSAPGAVFPQAFNLVAKYNSTFAAVGGILLSFFLDTRIEGNGAIDARCLDIIARNQGTGVLNFINGINIRDFQNTGGGTITKAVGLNISNLTAGTSNYSIITGTANVGIGAAAPTAQLHVDQSSTIGAKPVLFLDQADVSEEMIQFESTIGVGNAIEAVGAKTLTVTHFIKVTLPGGLTRYMEVGTIA